LLRFASKTSKNRRSGDFLLYKLRKEPDNRGFCGTKWRENLQAQQAPRSQGIGVYFFSVKIPLNQRTLKKKIHRKGEKVEEGRRKKDLNTITYSPYSPSR
jgi:hypothetical protein